MRAHGLRLFAALGAVALGLAGCGSDIDSGPSTRVVKAASLNGAQETPAVTTAAIGTALFTIDMASGAIEGTVNTTNVDGTVAHIHEGPVGVASPVIIPLDKGTGGVWTVPANTVLTASPDNATQQYLYRARLDGSGTPERVTPSDQPGFHTYVLAPKATMAFHTWSRFETPPVTEVIDLAGHAARRALTDVKPLAAKVAPLLTPPAEFFTVDVGGATLDGWMIKPAAFDVAKRYPLIVYVYGEPANQTVVDRWGGATMLFHRALAEAGYIVVSVDST